MKASTATLTQEHITLAQQEAQMLRSLFNSAELSRINWLILDPIENNELSFYSMLTGAGNADELSVIQFILLATPKVIRFEATTREGEIISSAELQRLANNYYADNVLKEPMANVWPDHKMAEEGWDLIIDPAVRTAHYLSPLEYYLCISAENELPDTVDTIKSWLGIVD